MSIMHINNKKYGLKKCHSSVKIKKINIKPSLNEEFKSKMH
jgi:hypothetical protein